MAPNAAKAAHRGDGGDLRNSQAGRPDTSNISQVATRPQDRLIAVVSKNARARFEIVLRNYQQVQRIDFRLREANGTGGYRQSGATITIAPSKLREIIEGLQEAERACVEMGAIRGG
jgi:hypothetical protein